MVSSNLLEYIYNQKLNMYKNIIVPLLLISLFISCEKDEELPPLPIVETIGSQLFSNGGVKLEGNISNLGDYEILDYGFELFANGNNIYYHVDHHAELPATQGQYFVEIIQNLYPDLEYYYTAYVTTELDIYKGERLSFISNGSATPIMTRCSPDITHIGDTVTLIGSSFPTDPNDVYFKFGNSNSEIISINESEIKFVVPKPEDDLRTLEISAYGSQVFEDGLLALYLPTINSTDPTTAFFGDTINIVGDHFNTHINYTNAKIGGFDAEIISTSRNEIEVIIPEQVNYSNSIITIYAQNEYVDYNNFNIKIPEFINVPTEVFTEEYFEIEVDKTYPNKNKFLISDREYYPEIIDDTRLRFYINSTALLEQRQNYIKWEINDIEVVSELPITIGNPFIKIKDGYNNNFPFAEYDVHTANNRVLVIGDIAYTDGKKYIYKLDDYSLEWTNQTLITENGSAHILGANVSHVYSEYTNSIYALKRSEHADNFIKINTDTGNITLLTSNFASQYFGKGFSYQNNIYYTTPLTNDLWLFDINSETWQVVSTLPYDISQYRNSYINAIVVGDYVYISNGSDDEQHNDFWRMNLISNQWEQLPDNPNPRKNSAVYLLNGELHFVTNEVWKYELLNSTWEIMINPGIPNSPYDNRVDSFKQNNIPYVIWRESATNVQYLNLFIGDLVD